MTQKNQTLKIHLYFMREIRLKMNDTKNRSKFIKEINLKLPNQENQFLIVHFNFI